MSKAKPEATPAPCCESHGGAALSGAAEESKKAFGAFMRTASAGGAVDEKTKHLILFSLVLLARCAPCVKAHLEKARKMGITQAELDEAAWCAVAIGGGPVKMLYDETLAARTPGKSCC